MEVRAAATRSREMSSDQAQAAAVPMATSASAVVATGARRGHRISARALIMNREQEYRYIRDDLVRLLITAGVLLGLMLIILFVVEG